MDYTNEIVDVLKKVAARNSKLVLEEGLNEAELAHAEEIYGFRFPPDLRALLSCVLPLDVPNREIRSWNDRQRFPNWRDVPNEYVQDYMSWTFDMIIDDVKRGWRLPDWTKQPQSGEDLESMTRVSLDAAPALIPVYGHRFLPATPCEASNPIFSMFGTDTIIYGSDLLEYFCAEFKVDDPRPDGPPLKKIAFWSALAGIK